MFGSDARFGLGMVLGPGNSSRCDGANPRMAHSILRERAVGNKHHPEIIVANPRKPETAVSATLRLAIQPRSDTTL